MFNAHYIPVKIVLKQADIIVSHFHPLLLFLALIFLAPLSSISSSVFILFLIERVITGFSSRFFRQTRYKI